MLDICSPPLSVGGPLRGDKAAVLSSLLTTSSKSHCIDASILATAPHTSRARPHLELPTAGSTR
jgi:hypothetical protein